MKTNSINLHCSYSSLNTHKRQSSSDWAIQHIEWDDLGAKPEDYNFYPSNSICNKIKTRYFK